MSTDACQNKKTVVIPGICGYSTQCDHCHGCGQPLLVENAWMDDGCPCNSRLGVNSTNETRWRLLRELQQQQQRELQEAKSRFDLVMDVFKSADAERLEGVHKSHDESEKWKSEGDMYGWNFHQGMASGMTSASIIFYRIRRLLESWGIK